MEHTLNISEIKERVAQNKSITDVQAMEILTCSDEQLAEILEITTEKRRSLFGDKISLCAIINAKSGRCSEDCRFCAQSAHYPAGQENHFDMVSCDDILNAYDMATEKKAMRFSPVTSGEKLAGDELDQLCQAIEQRKGPARWCASLGCLNEEELKKLAAAGVKRYHHNIEAAESFYPNICTTHDFSRRINTLRAARKAGMEICCGGIFGLGESLDQRVEFARILENEQVDSVPINFLIPIPGTPLENQPRMEAGEIIRAIAMIRLVIKSADIRVIAGRELLGDRQREIYAAGASGIMIGDFLTRPGNELERDLKIITDEGLTIVDPERSGDE